MQDGVIESSADLAASAMQELDQIKLSGGGANEEKLQNMLLELKTENANLQQRFSQLQRLEDN
jgi:Tfp pilus assembly PilM family ATPase